MVSFWTSASTALTWSCALSASVEICLLMFSASVWAYSAVADISCFLSSSICSIKRRCTGSKTKIPKGRDGGRLPRKTRPVNLCPLYSYEHHRIGIPKRVIFFFLIFLFLFLFLLLCLHRAGQCSAMQMATDRKKFMCTEQREYRLTVAAKRQIETPMSFFLLDVPMCQTRADTPDTFQMRGAARLCVCCGVWRKECAKHRAQEHQRRSEKVADRPQR